LCGAHKKNIKNERLVQFFSKQISIKDILALSLGGKMDTDFTLAGFVALTLLVYLVYAMFNAEKF
jgi:K+-transporting ATPase KdpF subunit